MSYCFDLSNTVQRLVVYQCLAAGPVLEKMTSLIKLDAMIMHSHYSLPVTQQTSNV